MDLGATTGSTVAQLVQKHLLDLGEQAVDEHVAVLTEVHRLLQDALATLDEV